MPNVLISELDPSPALIGSDLLLVQHAAGPPADYCTMVQVSTYMLLAHAFIYISAPAATTVTNQNTFYKMAGTTTLGNSTLFTMPTNNRALYSGTAARDIFLNCSITFNCSNNAQNIGFQVWKFTAATNTGAYLTSSLMARTITVGANSVVVSLCASDTANTGDYFEIHTNNATSGGTTVTAQYMSLMVQATLQ